MEVAEIVGKAFPWLKAIQARDKSTVFDDMVHKAENALANLNSVVLKDEGIIIRIYKKRDSGFDWEAWNTPKPKTKYFESEIF